MAKLGDDTDYFKSQGYGVENPPHVSDIPRAVGTTPYIPVVYVKPKPIIVKKQVEVLKLDPAYVRREERDRKREVLQEERRERDHTLSKVLGKLCILPLLVPILLLMIFPSVMSLVAHNLLGVVLGWFLGLYGIWGTFYAMCYHLPTRSNKNASASVCFGVLCCIEIFIVIKLWPI